MKQYKYTLDKSSKKYICPDCKRKTFVKYVETETGNYLSDEFGRCDRESNCGYHVTPKAELTNTIELKYIPLPEPSFHSKELVDRYYSLDIENNLSLFLETVFTREQVFEAEQKYLVTGINYFGGCSTVFWQIDNSENVHAGKILLYDKATGKRVKTKEGRGLINWVHKILKLETFNLNQCLFGLHLINETSQRTIAIVESEKTALMMSLFKPEYTWMATGSKQGFKYEMLKPLKDYHIIAFPDKSEFEHWKNKAVELNGFGFKITVSDWLENTDFPDGSDLADIYMNGIKTVLI